MTNLFKASTKTAEDIPVETRIAHLEEQKRYQQGRLQYTVLNNGSKKKRQYHLDKLDYIDSKLAQLKAEG